MNQGAVSHEGVRTSEAERRAAVISAPMVSRSAPAMAPGLAAAGSAPSRIPAGRSFPDAALAAGRPLSRPSQVPVGEQEAEARAARVQHVQRSPAGPTTSPAVNTSESIAAALASVTVVDKTKEEMLLHPQEMFALVPRNSPAKEAAFSAVNKAVRRLRGAEKKVQAATASGKPKQIAAATAEFEAAEKGVETGVETVKAFILRSLKSDDAKYRSFTKKETGAKAKLANLEKPSMKALSPADQAKHDVQVAALKSTVADLDSKIKSEEAALSAQVDAGNYRSQSTERHYYTVTVDGETVNMHDHIEAYATTMASGVEGKAKGEGSGNVASVVETSGLSASRKKILKTISHAEGGFTAVNTWDRARLTWGFVQWAGGSNSDLTAVLSIIKEVSPDAFQARFAKYGIDVVDNGVDKKLVVTNGSGTAVKGPAAASAVQSSPLLTAIMSRAGMDPEIQKAEVKAADQVEIQRPIDQPLNIKFTVPNSTLPKKTKVIRLGDVLTSEYAVGVLVDQTVHGGMPSFLDRATAALQKFVDDNDVEAADVKTWAGQAEAAMLPTVIQWQARAKAIADAGCSKAAHSFS